MASLDGFKSPFGYILWHFCGFCQMIGVQEDKASISCITWWFVHADFISTTWIIFVVCNLLWVLLVTNIDLHVGCNCLSIFYRVLLLPASVCPSILSSVCPSIRAITYHPFKLGSPNLDHRCRRPWLWSPFWEGGGGGWLTLTFKVKFNFKVKIYPILSLWVCPHDKSPPIEVRIIKFGQKVHLSTVKVSEPWKKMCVTFWLALWLLMP